MRDSIAGDPGRLGSADAPPCGVKRSFDQARPAVVTPGHPSLSPKCSSPCPSFIEVPGALRAERVMNTDTCRSSLGDRSFAILRNAMLQQQETFLEQLWELHRLARSQGRKAALLATDARLTPVQSDAQAVVLNPQQQVHLHQMTMEAILGMQTIPASLRHPVVIASPGPSKTSPAPVTSEQNQATKAPDNESLAAPAAARIPSHQPTPDVSSAAFPGQLMMCPLGMNMPYAQPGISCPPQHGYGLHGDPNAVSFHWPGGPPQYAGAALPAFHPGALPGFGSVAPAAAPFLQGMGLDISSP